LDFFSRELANHDFIAALPQHLLLPLPYLRRA
jgi:hypothetical protein